MKDLEMKFDSVFFNNLPSIDMQQANRIAKYTQFSNNTPILIVKTETKSFRESVELFFS